MHNASITVNGRDVARGGGQVSYAPPPQRKNKIKCYSKNEKIKNELARTQKSGQSPGNFWFLVGGTLARLAPSWTKSWLRVWSVAASDTAENMVSLQKSVGG